MPQKRMLRLADALQTIDYVAKEYISGKETKYSPLKVIAFETIEDFVAEFQTDEFIGFMQPAMREHVLAFGLASNTLQPYNIAFHEYTHFVSRTRYDYFVPLWYEEGFAQYIGNARLRGDDVILGSIKPRRFIQSMRRNSDKWRTILDGVPRLDWHEHDYEDHYEFAHAVVHLLHHGVSSQGEPLRPQVESILYAISRKEKPSEVLPRFLGIPPEEFTDYVIDHLRSKPAGVRFAVDRSKFSSANDLNCLTEVEARKLLAGVLVRKNPNRAFEHIELAQAQAPDDLDLQVILSYMPSLDTLSSYERVRQVLEQNPKHVDANIRMGDLFSYNCLGEESEECTRLREDASHHYRQALIQQPRRMDAAFGLGVSLLRTGRAGDGLNYLRIAYQRLPWNARVNLFLGEAYLQTGNLPDATTHLEKSVLWEGEESIRERAIDLLNIASTATSRES